MRVFACISAASLALAGAAEAAPRRVASLNLCTDELVLALGSPAQIASVTHLSQRPEETPYWQAARRHRRNDGTLLSVAPLKPDLVLTMGGGARDRGRIAERLGLRLLDLPYPQTISDIEQAVTRVASALGREEAGRALLARIAVLKRTAPRAAKDAIWLGGGGRTVSVDGLAAQWMRLAGLRQRSLQGDRVGLETLLVSPPAILLRSDYRKDQYSSEQRWLAHPLARRARGSRSIATDGRRWTCMGPAMIDEVLRLRRAVRQ